MRSAHGPLENSKSVYGFERGLVRAWLAVSLQLSQCRENFGRLTQVARGLVRAGDRVRSRVARNEGSADVLLELRLVMTGGTDVGAGGHVPVGRAALQRVLRSAFLDVGPLPQNEAVQADRE